jgi:alkylation response protein AidB-like acyl-CoA dehydrogenase
MALIQQLLTEVHKARHEEFKAFTDAQVAPVAAEWDRAARIPRAALTALSERGYLGTTIAPEYGGRGWDAVTFGLLNEALGRGSSAFTGVVTVQGMVAMALQKWGSDAQRHDWLPRLASGAAMGAIALTEPGGGSDLQGLATTFTRAGDQGLRISGTKRWISCAQFADVFLVFGKLDGLHAACLVARETPGLSIDPITDLMGFRAGGLAELRLRDCEVPVGNLVGKPGFALSHVAPVALQYGRLSTAWSAIGLARACFEESIVYAANRKVRAAAIAELGMIRSLIARMGTDLEAGALLCHAACRAQDERRPDAFERALMAKYFASRAAVRTASDAVQIHGAAGCHASSPISRYYRDAKIMEIIEGTTQVHEDLLGRLFVDRHEH